MQAEGVGSARELKARWLANASVSVQEALRIADHEAAAELDRVNASWNVEEFEECEGPSRLADYARDVTRRDMDGRPVVWVFYQYTKPAGFLGHPLHFTVLVFCDNGEARLNRGT